MFKLLAGTYSSHVYASCMHDNCTSRFMQIVAYKCTDRYGNEFIKDHGKPPVRNKSHAFEYEHTNLNKQKSYSIFRISAKSSNLSQKLSLGSIAIIQ